MDQMVIVGFLMGAVLGAWGGFKLGVWVTAVRSAKATYRTQRHRAKRKF